LIVQWSIAISSLNKEYNEIHCKAGILSGFAVMPYLMPE